MAIPTITAKMAKLIQLTLWLDTLKLVSTLCSYVNHRRPMIAGEDSYVYGHYNSSLTK
jgi:hypothetical protein